MKKYDSYKDSGVKWLGEIPSHWEMLPGLAVFQENKCKNSDLSVNNVLSLSYGKIIEKKDINEGLVPAEYNTYQIVHPGYIIIRCTDLQNDKVSLRTGLVKNDGIITNAYLGLVVNKEYNYSYIHYFLHAWDITKEIYRHGSGLRQSLSWLDLRRLPILLPSLQEQEAIANYLDSATSKIDEAIAQQQKMIDLLNERKQIIINNAVTKGLDPNVKMKPSGIDWIGDIPEGWETFKFNNIITILTDYTANGSFGDLAKNVHYQSEGYAKLVRLTDLRENLQNDNSVWVDKHGYDYLSKSSLYGGELLMANVGAYSGLPCIMPNVNYPATLAPNMFLIKIDNSIVNTEFLYYLLLSKTYFSWLQTIAMSSAQPKLNKDNIRSLPIIIPLIDEQTKITTTIKNKLKPIESLIKNSNNQISLLQERKQIIINDVVTGKVKVC